MPTMWITLFHSILYFAGPICVCAASTSSNVVDIHVAEGDIRLVNETKHGTGRVEIFHNNQWGTVCNDYWDIDDATVVCRQLGYPSAVGIGNSTKNSNKRMSQSMPIWLDNVRCNSIESKLIECIHNGWGKHNCDPEHSEDAFVQCQVESKYFHISNINLLYVLWILSR